MIPNALSHSWPAIREQLRNAVAEATWDLWLEPLRARAIENSELVLEAPARTREWIEQRYGRLLAACAASELGPDTRVRLVCEGEGDAGDAAASGARTPRPSGQRTGQRINPRLTFEQFVIGDSNRMAHAAALAVAELPALAYNPLFICGAPGLGKSHLLHSIANYVRTHDESLEVRLTNAEAFTNEFLGALHGSGDIEAFKTTHRDVDLLLVDDVQFLQSKARTEQEFFHLFNELHANGAQIVLSSDRPPRDMDALEDRLRERFEAGLVCDIGPPDRDTRLTILRKRVLQDDVGEVDAAALELIADRVTDNVRALEGALIRVVAYGSLTGRPVSAALAEEVLGGLRPVAPVRRRSMREIQDHVCAAFGIALEDMLSSSRAATVAWPRQLAMYLAREITGESLPAVGRAFGNRSHTTVMHACKRTTERIAKDPEAHRSVHKLQQELTA